MKQLGQRIKFTAAQAVAGSAVVARTAASPSHPASRSEAAPIAASWGWLPALSVVSALAVLLVAIAHSGARNGANWAETLFWAGLVVLVTPLIARQTAAEVPRRERIGLVVVCGLSLYLAKIMHSPVAFTFTDELVHFYNVKEILQTGHLFHENPILPVTPFYPGLPTVTIALAGLTGMTIFSAGIIVVGAARLVLSLALYLFYEQISRSARVAGLAAMLYMANSNFVFWSAQFAYESLALPLAIMTLFVLVRWERTPPGAQKIGLTATALLVLMAVVITHHMTAYALLALLCVVSLGERVVSRRWQSNISGWVLIALVTTLAWLLYVASQTIGYLSPVLGGAVSSIIQVAAHQETGRQLFQSSEGNVAPLWERLTGIGSVLLILLGVPFGLLQIWRRQRGNVFALVLAAAALSYFGALALRFTSAGWETSNRASEFLFVGIAFVLAIGIVEFWMRYQIGWIGRALFTEYAVLIFLGGVIAGWSPDARLARPYRVAAGDSWIEPQGLAAAQWMRGAVGPGNRMATDPSNARLMLAYGDQYPYSGEKYGIREMLFSAQFGRGEREVLQVTGIRYVVLDHRLISWDSMIGTYFDRTKDGVIPDTDLIDPETFEKFEQQPLVNRIFDSGTIVIYDLEGLHGDPSLK